MNQGLYEGISDGLPAPSSGAVRRKSGEVADRIRSYVLEKKVERSAVQDSTQRKDLGTIESDIVRTENEQQYRQSRIDALDATLAKTPPHAPTRVNLTPGEALGAGLGILAGTAYEGATAAYGVADKRQQVEHQNALMDFATERENAARQVEREERISDFLRGQRAQLGMARIQTQGAIEDANAQRGWQTDMAQLQHAWDEHSRAEQNAFQKSLMEQEHGWNLQIEDIRQKNALAASRIEFALKGVLASEDPESVEATLRGLAADGFVMGDGDIALFRKVAQFNKDNRAFAELMQKREQDRLERVANEQIRASQANSALQRDQFNFERSTVTPSGPITIDKSGGSTWNPGQAPAGPNAPANPNNVEQIGFNWMVTSKPAMTKEQADRHEVMRTARETFDAANAAYQAWNAKKPKASGQGFQTKAERDWEEQSVKLRMEADAAQTAWEQAVDAFKVSAPDSWAAYVTALRAAAKADIDRYAKLPDKAEGKRLADAVRRQYLIQTGEKF